jgi:YD repeat-containing protein
LLLSVTDAASQITTYAYNRESRLTDIYDANSNHTQFLWHFGDILYQTAFESLPLRHRVWDAEKSGCALTGNSRANWYIEREHLSTANGRPGNY